MTKLNETVNTLEAVFCPHFQPFPVKDALGNIKWQFFPCLKEKCAKYRQCLPAVKSV